MATTAVDSTRNPTAFQRYYDAAFMRDDKKFYFGDDGDAALYWDSTNSKLAMAGGTLAFSDTQLLAFGDGTDATITWDLARLALGGTWDLSGVDVQLSDTQKLEFGNAGDVTVNWTGAALVVTGLSDINPSLAGSLFYVSGSDLDNVASDFREFRFLVSGR